MAKNATGGAGQENGDPFAQAEESKGKNPVNNNKKGADEHQTQKQIMNGNGVEVPQNNNNKGADKNNANKEQIMGLDSNSNTN